MQDKPYWLHIMANQRNGTLYVGTISDLIQRIAAHKDGRGAAFANKHGLKLLVYYEQHAGYEDARIRETRVKRWRRAWKIKFIEDMNPEWRDLYPELMP
jgi:putative endonuclease